MADSTPPAGAQATRRRFWIAVLSTAAAALLVLCVAPLIGSTHIDYSRALAGLSPDREILFYTRLPRVLLALLAGGALAVAGVLFQAMLRDALATPYTLGVSSGASLGAVAAICFGWREAGHLPAIWLAAFAGAALVLDGNLVARFAEKSQVDAGWINGGFLVLEPEIFESLDREIRSLFLAPQSTEGSQEPSPSE